MGLSKLLNGISEDLEATVWPTVLVESQILELDFFFFLDPFPLFLLDMWIIGQLFHVLLFLSLIYFFPPYSPLPFVAILINSLSAEISLKPLLFETLS